MIGTTSDETLSACVQVFGRRHDEAIHALRRPASEKRQCTKSRECGTRQCSECYGDRMLVAISMVDTARAKRLRAQRKLIAEIVATSISAKSRLDPEWAGGLLVALEDGFRLHRLIDPTSTPADSFFEAVERLQRLIAA